MFEESKDPEDIFSSTEAAPDPKVVSPSAPGTGSTQVGANVPLDMDDSDSSPRRSIVIAAVVIIVVVLALAAVLIGVWYIRQNAAQAPAPAATTAAPVSLTPPAETPAAPLAPETALPAAPAQPIDTDRDGLTDAQEATLKTDAAQADTDADGLNDYEEVMVWTTDPLNPDTDADGYPDGKEVQSGYDPKLKGGRLLTPPQTNANTDTSTPS